MKVGDLINNNGVIEIVTETSGESVANKEPLKDHVMKCYMINHNGNFISIADLVDDLMNEIINKATN